MGKRRQGPRGELFTPPRCEQRRAWQKELKCLYGNDYSIGTLLDKTFLLLIPHQGYFSSTSFLFKFIGTQRKLYKQKKIASN